MRRSNISWTAYTHNFWVGCTQVSEGCKFCYAKRELKGRFNIDFEVVKKVKNFSGRLKKYNKEAFGKPLSETLVFTCSLSDFFHPDADEFRAEAWAIIKECKNLNFQILTKSPERIFECLPNDWGDNGYRNVWLGISVENQKRMDERAQYFEKLGENKNRNYLIFASFEPLLDNFHIPNIPLDWAIIGGESGNETGPYKYRPCTIFKISNMVEQLKVKQIPVFVKQTGTHIAKALNYKSKSGADISEWPPIIQFQELPKIKQNEQFTIF